MKPEAFSRVWKQFELLAADLCRMFEAETYEAAMLLFTQRLAAQGPHFAIWLYDYAHQCLVAPDADNVEPDRFIQVIGWIDTKEKVKRELLKLSDDAAPMVEKTIQTIRKEVLPDHRIGFEEIARLMPHRRGGGPRRLDAEECRKIAEEIFDDLRKNFPVGVAQKRAATNHNRGVRTIQRIWADRAKYISPDGTINR